MISLTNHDSQWGRSEVVIIYPDNITTYHLIAVLVPKKPPGTTSHDEFSLPWRTPGILRVFVFVLKFYHKTPGEFNGFHDWLVVFRPTPLKNDGVRQLRWWNSQLNGKKEVPNHQPDDFTMKSLTNPSMENVAFPNLWTCWWVKWGSTDSPIKILGQNNSQCSEKTTDIHCTVYI